MKRRQGLDANWRSAFAEPSRRQYAEYNDDNDSFDDDDIMMLREQQQEQQGGYEVDNNNNNNNSITATFAPYALREEQDKNIKKQEDISKHNLFGESSLSVQLVPETPKKSTTPFLQLSTMPKKSTTGTKQRKSCNDIGKQQQQQQDDTVTSWKNLLGKSFHAGSGGDGDGEAEEGEENNNKDKNKPSSTRDHHHHQQQQQQHRKVIIIHSQTPNLPSWRLSQNLMHALTERGWKKRIWLLKMRFLVIL